MPRFALMAQKGKFTLDFVNLDMKLAYEILRSKNSFALIVIPAIFGLPHFAVADHVPDNLSQDLNPNYISCLATVDRAEAEFRDALQAKCLERMGDICSGRDGLAPPSQVIDCINFETRRGIEFLEIAANDLPASTENGGLFGHSYESRRASILADVEMLKNLTTPKTIETAVQRNIIMASAATTFFWLARETGTSIATHVLNSFGAH